MKNTKGINMGTPKYKPRKTIPLEQYIKIISIQTNAGHLKLDYELRQAIEKAIAPILIKRADTFSNENPR